MPVARHYCITGKVQGVGFRHFTRRSADDLGISGWVRNRFDGSVETVGWASEEVLNSFRAELETGPRWSRVASVVENRYEGSPPRDGVFEVRSTS